MFAFIKRPGMSILGFAEMIDSDATEVFKQLGRGNLEAVIAGPRVYVSWDSVAKWTALHRAPAPREPVAPVHIPAGPVINPSHPRGLPLPDFCVRYEVSYWSALSAYKRKKIKLIRWGGRLFVPSDEEKHVAEVLRKMARETRGPDDPGVMTIRQMAAEYGMKASTIYDMVRSGELPSVKRSGQVHIRRADVEAWADKRTSARETGEGHAHH